MNLIVRTLRTQCSLGRCYGDEMVTTLDNILLNDTIGDIKQKILDNVGIPLEHQTLFFDDEELQDALTILYYNIQNNNIVYVNISVPDL